MKIANPIYGGAFKYLMKDLTAARRFISILLNREIEVDSFQTQEILISDADKDKGFSAQRMDFAATIIEPNGRRRKVLIELQKGRNKADAGRFRRYLARHYGELDIINGQALDLEIISIYILGFQLDNIPVAVVKTSTKLIDASAQEELNINTDDESFIRQLHHESIFIDITKLSGKLQTRVDKLLTIFNQNYIDERTKYKINIPEDILKQLDEDNIIIKRLEHALEDKDTLFELNEQQKFQENLRAERAQIKLEGQYETTRKIAANMLKANFPLETTASITQLSLDELNKMQN